MSEENVTILKKNMQLKCVEFVKARQPFGGLWVFCRLILVHKQEIVRTGSCWSTRGSV